MDTTELLSAISTDEIMKNTCIGVFSCNNLPEIKQYPSFFIANTDPSSKPGQHWVLVYVSSANSCEYFDSYGREPEGPFADYTKNFPLVTWNRKQVQSFTSVACGAHCLFVAWHRSRSNSLADVLTCYIADVDTNDDFVTEFVHETFVGGTCTYIGCCQGCRPIVNK